MPWQATITIDLVGRRVVDTPPAGSDSAGGWGGNDAGVALDPLGDELPKYVCMLTWPCVRPADHLTTGRVVVLRVALRSHGAGGAFANSCLSGRASEIYAAIAEEYERARVGRGGLQVACPGMAAGLDTSA